MLQIGFDLGNRGEAPTDRVPQSDVAVGSVGAQESPPPATTRSEEQLSNGEDKSDMDRTTADKGP